MHSFLATLLIDFAPTLTIASNLSFHTLEMIQLIQLILWEGTKCRFLLELEHLLLKTHMGTNGLLSSRNLNRHTISNQTKAETVLSSNITDKVCSHSLNFARCFVRCFKKKNTTKITLWTAKAQRNFNIIVYCLIRTTLRGAKGLGTDQSHS